MQTGVSKYIGEDLSAAINIANLVPVVLSISVKDTDIRSRSRSGGPEDTVNDWPKMKTPAARNTHSHYPRREQYTAEQKKRPLRPMECGIRNVATGKGLVPVYKREYRVIDLPILGSNGLLPEPPAEGSWYS